MNACHTVPSTEATPQPLADPVVDTEAAAGARDPLPDLSPAEVVVYDALRRLRRRLAAEQSQVIGYPVALFHVLTNATVRELARLRPADSAALLQIYGIGKRRAIAFGAQILHVLDVHAAAGGLSRLDAAAIAAAARVVRPGQDEASSAARRAARSDAFEAFAAGCSVAEVCRRTGRAPATVEDYLVAFVAGHGISDPEPWVDTATCDRIVATAGRLAGPKLKPLYEALDGEVPYAAIRVALLVRRVPGWNAHRTQEIASAAP